MNKIGDIYANKFENFIFPFFWMHGESEEVLVDYMQKIHDSHIGAVCLESRPHPDFMGDRWWADLDIIIREAKRLNMKIWILDDSHFPTGYANGLVKEKYPDRLKTLLTHRVVEVFGPKDSIGVMTANIFDPTARLIAVYAKQDDKIIDLKDQIDDEIIYFNIPAGSWKVYLLYESRKVDYNPDYINMVDKESCDVLIEAVYEPHYQRYKEEFGRTIAGFFSDEPGFMNEKGVRNDSRIGKLMPLPWSRQVKEMLQLRLGKDYLLQLSSLWYDETCSPEIRHVFMDICTTLYKECFSDNLGNWCRERNVEYVGHVIEDRDSNARLGVGAGHLFRAMAGQDMAGVDVVLNQLIPGMDSGEHPTFRGTWDSEFFHYALVKMASSLGAIDPKKKGRTMAEVFGAYGWYEGVKMMKWIVDHFLIRGVSYFVPHAFSLKGFPDMDCPPHFYANGNDPQFRYFGDLMKYVNKMSTLFSGTKGKPTAAILYHAEAEWTGDFMLTQKPARVLTQQQIDFHILPNDVFTFKDSFLTVLDNYLHVNGYEYQCLILPYCECISEELAQFIIASANSHLRIICIDALPSKLFNSSNTDLLNQMSHVEVVKLDELSHYMKANQLHHIEVATSEPYLRFASFAHEDGEYLMFFNEDPLNMIQTSIQIESDKPIYKFDVLNNKITKVEYDGKSFPLVLSPYESFVYVLGEIDASIVGTEVIIGHKVKVVDSPYKVSIANVQEYPDFREAFTMEQLENLSLTKYLPKFSGTFRYETEVQLDQDINAAILDLGRVFEVADVTINGTFIGTRICPPYHFEAHNILKSGMNTICVDVTNTLDKQLRDYFSYGEEIQPSGLLDNIVIKY
ncbi:glycoside hydrolase family 2 [Paenibacillus sp. FSL R7-0333]|uniref:glycoside hydrolase family 2 n=1 Tax=Paenibacillus sp. FSL R7-0333 TaxID=1926587 RepID=UPI00096E1E94|nr:glycoside hydrolase family 2 [Paenibacillus sp. FSL R7-0333]